MSYFSQRAERENKVAKPAASEMRLDGLSAVKQPEMVSTLGQGMLITGNIVCAGSVQIFGCVIGDIHASQLIIGEGARVEGKVIAAEAAIRGTFSGTIHANSVKLQSTAVVEGEIFNKSLTIEQNCHFEGIARRLDRPIEPPSATQAKGEDGVLSLSPQVAPISEIVI